MDKDQIKEGDKFYHYENIGSIFWGMKEYAVLKVGTGCMCHSPFYVEAYMLDNNSKAHIVHINSNDLEANYFKTKKEAWKKRLYNLQQEILSLNESMKRIEDAIEEANSNITDGK